MVAGTKKVLVIIMVLTDMINGKIVRKEDILRITIPEMTIIECFGDSFVIIGVKPPSLFNFELDDLIWRNSDLDSESL